MFLKVQNEEVQLLHDEKIFHCPYKVLGFWTNEKKIKRGWFDEFNKIFSTIYPYCVLTCQWHKWSLRCKSGKSFQALAKYKHTSCTWYKFIMNEAIAYPHTEHILLVFTENNCDHSSHENHRRFVRERKFYAKELKKSSPALKLKLLIDMPEDVLKTWIRRYLEIFQKISSENHSRDDSTNLSLSCLSWTFDDECMQWSIWWIHPKFFGEIIFYNNVYWRANSLL